ncbi:MAG: NAD(P)/FAD-dependent oxidoreductase [bacterium]|nr:NAD(P)/FAD-dependent oxidoreductase [bacterium]
METVIERNPVSQQISQHIPESKDPRIVIIGGGFAGIELVARLANLPVQVVLLDKHNFHTFQPLLYQVATAGLGPGDISSPLREFLRNKNKNFHFRLATVEHIDHAAKNVITDTGSLHYDYLVIASGAIPNYFGNEELQRNAHSLKSIPEALELRNSMIENFEKALLIKDEEELQKFMNVVIVGAGPTGVELAGAIEELRRNVLPKDYPELDFSKMQIHLIEGQDQVLGAMSDFAGRKAKKYLENMGVNVQLQDILESYDGETAVLKNGDAINTHCLIWAAGVKGNAIDGVGISNVKGGRIAVNHFNEVTGMQDVFAIGDVALMLDEDNPRGYPMLAPVAIQQAENLGRNFEVFIGLKKDADLKPFKYFDKGTMATIGRNKAVVDAPFGIKFGGFFGWFAWMFIHLVSIIGFRRKLLVFSNWLWNYFTYNRGNRFIIKKKN